MRPSTMETMLVTGGDDSHGLARAFTLYDTLPLPKELILIHPIITSISTLRSTAYVKTCFPHDLFIVC